MWWSVIRRFFGRSKKRAIRLSLFTMQVVILLAVIGFVWRGSSSPSQGINQNAMLGVSEETSIVNPLDQLSSADVAVQLARAASFYEVDAVASNAISVGAQLSLPSGDEKVVAKPQVVATSLKSRRDIKTYTAVEGDTIASVATKFGITSDTIRWSNDLTGNDLTAGKELVISPVNGIVYTVQSGDTPDSLATKYRANKDQLVAFNDAELSGLKVGDRIVIPDGAPPTPRRSTFSAGFAWGGNAAVYRGNGYDYGYCTWWAAVRRAQVGKPIPSNLGNASTWKVLAQRAGLEVGNTPRQYAVIWTPPRDYYGHVGFVEEVLSDGTVKVSEMNTAGWNRVSYRTLSPEQASGYSYIY